MSLVLSLLVGQSLSVSTEAVDARTVARIQIPPYQLSVIETGRPYAGQCSLELVAESHETRLTADAGFRYFKCGVRGAQALHAATRESRDEISVVFKTGYGGDGDYTGPVLLFFNLETGQLKREGVVEIFSPKISWTDKGVAQVAGQLLFTYCDVCDGPGTIFEEIYVPVDIEFDGNAIETAPRFDAKQATDFYNEFESYGVRLYGENWPSVREQNDHVVKQFDALIELLSKTGWSTELESADNKRYEVRLWVNEADVPPGFDSGDIEDKESGIFEHPCGYARETDVEALPPPGYSGFIEGAEKVLEMNRQGDVISRWAMPVDSRIMGVSGDKIIVSYRKQSGPGEYELMGLEISTAGELRLRDALEANARTTECPSAFTEYFEVSSYLRCVEFEDLKSGEKRVLAYEGACT